MKDIIKKEQRLLELLSDIYIFIIIVIFPLIVDKSGFFHILECKWYSFVTIASIYLLLNLLVIIYYLFFKKTSIIKQKKFSIIQWLAITFLLINILSCFISPYFKTHNLFIGVGRGEGLIAISLYVLSFIFATLFGRFKKKHILYFSISSILLNIIAILQYIGFNPLNMYQDGIGTHNVSFMGTIGNIDFISAMYCILLSVSFSAYVFLEDNKIWEKIIHLLSVLMGSFIIGIINVQSGKLAFLVTLMIVIPFIFISNKRLSRFLIMIATILISYCINVIINPVYHYRLNRLVFHWQFNYIVILFIIVSLTLAYLSTVLNKREYSLKSTNKVIKYYYLGLIGCGFLGLTALYFINFQNGFLYEIHEILHGNFDDSFGTYRIFLWKRTLSLIPEYPLLGSGTDSFALRFMAKYSEDVAAIGPYSINDTAANVYLTMLINIGIIGLLNYLLFILFQIKEGIKKINNYSGVLLIPIICYLIQDFFNLSLVIVSPVFWILLAIHFISFSKEKV